jgi:hypothetical protein
MNYPPSSTHAQPIGNLGPEPHQGAARTLAQADAKSCTVAVHSRVHRDTLAWMQEYAKAKDWNVSKLISIAVREMRKRVEGETE